MARRVFLAHTSDLHQHPWPESYVAAAEDAVKRVGDAVVNMQYFGARHQPPAELCRKLVQSADVFVLVMGARWGSPVLDRPEVSYSELEHEAAVQARIPRLVFTLAPNAAGPPQLFEDHLHGPRQVRFRERVERSGVTRSTIHSPADLKVQLVQALHSLNQPRRRPSNSAAVALVAITLVAVVLGALLVVDRWPRNSSGGAAPAGVSPTVVDPFLYLGVAGQQPSRELDCDGMLGFCMWSDMAIVQRSLGPVESPGYPFSFEQTEYRVADECHQWEPPQVGSIEVCGLQGSVSSIRLRFSDRSDLRIPLARGLRLDGPSTMAFGAQDITTAFDAEPFESTWLPSEGESLLVLSWFLPPLTDGGPELKLTLLGRLGNFDGPAADPCTGPFGSDYPYSSILPLAGTYPVLEVELAAVTQSDLDRDRPRDARGCLV